MTPVEILEYKNKWMSSGVNNPVTLHSDRRRTAKDWCKINLEKCKWSYSQFTDVYEDTAYFEDEEDAKLFSTFLKNL